MSVENNIISTVELLALSELLNMPQIFFYSLRLWLICKIYYMCALLPKYRLLQGP